MDLAQYEIMQETNELLKEIGKGLEDLEKIIHEVELIIEIEGWGSKPTV